MQHIWHDCSRLLESELTPQQFSAWIKPLKAIDFDEASSTLTISAPNRLKLETIRTQFSGQIANAASRVLQRQVAVVLELAAAKTAAARPEAVPSLASPTQLALPVMVAEPPSEATEHVERARINSQLTFDNFVTGKANQLARAAAMQVA
ncbi:MAG: DnaA N-terminal domain-containing protein, partial [Burkholderiaceae bacterium]